MGIIRVTIWVIGVMGIIRVTIWVIGVINLLTKSP